MWRANNKCSSCSFKVQQIFRSVIGIHHKSCNLLILICKLLFSQIFMLNMGEPILGYLNSHVKTAANQTTRTISVADLVPLCGRTQLCLQFATNSANKMKLTNLPLQTECLQNQKLPKVCG